MSREPLLKLLRNWWALKLIHLGCGVPEKSSLATRKVTARPAGRTLVTTPAQLKTLSGSSSRCQFRATHVSTWHTANSESGKQSVSNAKRQCSTPSNCSVANLALLIPACSCCRYWHTIYQQTALAKQFVFSTIGKYGA